MPKRLNLAPGRSRLLTVGCRVLVATCLLSSALGCAPNHAREARASGQLKATTLRVQVTGEGAEFEAGGPALEVFVDGNQLTDQDGKGDAYAEFAAIQIATGEHTIETRVELRSSDRKSRATIASSERVEVGDGMATLRIDVVLGGANASPVHRVEVRYSGESVRLIHGSLPIELGSVEPSTTRASSTPRAPGDDESPMLKADRIALAMKNARNAVRSRLFVARSRRDVIVALCQNDKLSEIDIALGSARDRRASLSRAIDKADADLMTHELTILTVLSQRVAQLDAESEECVGEDSAVARAERGGT